MQIIGLHQSPGHHFATAAQRLFRASVAREEELKDGQVTLLPFVTLCSGKVCSKLSVFKRRAQAGLPLPKE